MRSELTVDHLYEIATKEPAMELEAKCEELDAALEQSISYLNSSDSLASLSIDAYWPKWNSPWWHMILLHEMDLARSIPTEVVEKVISALNSDYLTYFPLTEEEIPSGVDPVRHIACHCQLGTMSSLLTACGINVQERLSWVRPWFIKYQQKDGGLNCDESAYVKPVPRSSVVSTLPPLEAVLASPTELSEQDVEFLDGGANYLMRKRLFRTESTGKEIDENWLRISFPRFYHYDVLRGLSFLVEWSYRLKRALPTGAIE